MILKLRPEIGACHCEHGETAEHQAREPLT